MPALLGEVLAMRHLAPLEPTGQQRVAVLIGHIGEVLAGHTDPCGPVPLQPINEVPFLFNHRNLLRLNRSTGKGFGRWSSDFSPLTIVVNLLGATTS